MNKKKILLGLSIFFLFSFLSLLIPFGSSDGSSGYTFNGSCVEWENSYGKLVVCPHTCRDFVCVQYANITSYYTTAINFSFVFPEPIKGKIWIWKNISHTVKKCNLTNETINYTIYNVSNISDAIDECTIGSEQSSHRSNVTFYNSGWQSIIACYDYYTQDGNNYTFFYNQTVCDYYYEEEWYYDWKDITSMLRHLEYNGEHFYYRLNSNFQAGETKKLKWLYYVPIRKNSFGYGSAGKWKLYMWRGDYKNPTQYAILDPWWNVSWKYRRTITINNTGNSLVNYPLPINISYYSGGQTDFDDIRFIDSDNTTKLPYYIEKKVDSQYAYTRVLVNVSASSLKTIYLYYGNPSATSESSYTDVWGTDLVAYWTLNEGSGTTVSDVTGTFSNTTSGDTVFTAGKFSYGLYFDGTDDYVKIGDVEHMPQFTVESWVKFDRNNVVEMPWAKQDEYYLQCNSDGTCKFFIRISGVNYNCLWNEVRQTGQWYYIVLTYDGDVLRGYVNGTEVCNNTDPSGNVDDQAYALDFGDYSNGGFDFKGYLDDIRIYRKVLSATEISNRHAYPEPTYTIGSEESLAAEDKVELISPSDYSTNYNLTITFQYKPTFYTEDIHNCSLWTNETGWSRKASNSTPVLNGSTNSITETFSDYGSYKWNIECYNSTHSIFGLSNYTVIVKSARPTIIVRRWAYGKRAPVMTTISDVAPTNSTNDWKDRGGKYPPNTSTISWAINLSITFENKYRFSPHLTLNWRNEYESGSGGCYPDEKFLQNKSEYSDYRDYLRENQIKGHWDFGAEGWTHIDDDNLASGACDGTGEWVAATPSEMRERVKRILQTFSTMNLDYNGLAVEQPGGDTASQNIWVLDDEGFPNITSYFDRPCMITDYTVDQLTADTEKTKNGWTTKCFVPSHYSNGTHTLNIVALPSNWDINAYNASKIQTLIQRELMVKELTHSRPSDATWNGWSEETRNVREQKYKEAIWPYRNEIWFATDREVGIYWIAKEHTSSYIVSNTTSEMVVSVKSNWTAFDTLGYTMMFQNLPNNITGVKSIAGNSTPIRYLVVNATEFWVDVPANTEINITLELGAQPVSEKSLLTVHAHYANFTKASGHSVTVKQGDTTICSGSTNSDGMYWCVLPNPNQKYNVTINSITQTQEVNATVGLDEVWFLTEEITPYFNLILENYTAIEFGTVTHNTFDNPSGMNGYYKITVNSTCEGKISLSNITLANGADSMTNITVSYSVNSATEGSRYTLPLNITNLNNTDYVRTWYYLSVPAWQKAGYYAGEQIITGECA